MRVFRPVFGALLAVLGLGITACDPSTGLAFPSANYHYNMANVTYRIADEMMLQTKDTLPKDVPLVVTTIADVNQLETTTPLGRALSEQLGSRFVQKGYKVSDLRFRNAINVKQDGRDATAAGEYILSRDTSVLKGEQEVGATLTGTYAVANNQVLVNLRLIAAGNSRVLAARDFRLPMTEDTRALLGEASFYKPSPYARDWNF